MSSLMVLVEQVQAAVAVLNAAVAAQGFDAPVTDAELHDAVIASQKAQSAMSVAGGRMLDRWDGRRVWAPGGHLNAASRLSHDAKLSKASARRELYRARRLHLMPLATAAVIDASLSVDHLVLLGRANQPHRRALFVRDEEMLVDICARLLWDEAERSVTYWCNHADAELAGDNHDGSGAPTDPPSELHVSPTMHRRVEITGSLDPVDGEIVHNEIDRLAREIYLADQQAGIERTPAQRRAAALVEMARRSAATPADARRPKPLFTVHIGEGTLRDMCELAGGTVITPRTAAKWVDDALMEIMLFSGPRTVLTVSQQRTFTGVLRRAIEARDRHCQHPSGCDVPARKCDVDHIVPHSQGGETSQFNGRLQCTTHNRHPDKHDHGAEPHPNNPVDFLAALRARLRWQYINDYGDHDDWNDKRNRRSIGDDPPLHHTG